MGSDVVIGNDWVSDDMASTGLQAHRIIYIIYIMRSKPTRHGYHGNAPRIRVVSAFRFRDVRFSCGLSIPAAAKVLPVSERTLHNWESGAVRISPEGHGFKASDHAWWSLLVRRAAMFG